ncbi:hypothetical protein CAEBREN_08901 [Caenorhabditis brenneri]|uniref:Uncharacterized protein n=1 Tax=Caenorhabditis brenneri TaxID=135651 RepID=G0NF57_CAEBE|nr:hypothetical protein CAEBREN_08901 [Caenorhabditis brenneri]
MNTQEKIKEMNLEHLLQTAVQMSTELDTKGTICRSWSETKRQRLKMEECTCREYSSNFDAIMERFKELKVEFRPEVMKEAVQKLISEFELVVNTELPNTKIILPTADEVSNGFDESIRNSRERIVLKGLRRTQQAEKNAQDKKKDCEKSKYKNCNKSITGKQYNVEVLRLDLWKKWIELNEMMLEGMELLESLKRWKNKVSNSIELLSSVLCQALKQSKFAADAKKQFEFVNRVWDSLKKMTFDWNLFTTQERNESAPHQVQATQKAVPHRFLVASMFQLPQTSTTSTQNLSPPLPVSTLNSSQTEVLSYSPRYQQIPAMMSPSFLPFYGMSIGSNESYQVPFFGNTIVPDVNVQTISQSSPTFWSMPMAPSPTYTFGQLPILRPSQNNTIHDAPKLKVGNHNVKAADEQYEGENEDLETLVKTASDMNHTLDRRGTIPDAKFCKKTKTAKRQKKAEWKEDELSLCKKYNINLEAIIHRFEELDAEFKPEVVQEGIERLFEKFLQVVRNHLPDFEVQLPKVEEFLEKFKATVTEARANINTKGSRRISQCEKNVEKSVTDLKRGDNKGIPRETKEKQYKADRLKLEVMQKWVKMNELMLEAFELREGLKKWKTTAREEIKEFLKTMYWTARIQGLDDTLKTKYALVNEIREVLEEISFDWDSFLQKPHQSNSTALAPVLTLSELHPMKEEVLEDVVEQKALIQQTNRNEVTSTPASTSVPPRNTPTPLSVHQPLQNFLEPPAVPVHIPNPPPVPFLNHQQTDAWLRSLYDAGNLYLMLPVWIPLRPNNHEVGANIRQNTPYEVPQFNTHLNANNQYMHLQNTQAQVNMPPHNNDDRYDAPPRGQLPTHWFPEHW